MKNHYQTLGLKNFASVADVKSAYRKLALTHHPDRGGEIRKMQEINIAYEYLMKNKEQYDLTLKPSRPVLKRTGFTISVGGAANFYATATEAEHFDQRRSAACTF